MNENRHRLHMHLGQIGFGTDAAWSVETQASTILANPQAHIDALVEAGVLERDEAWVPVPGRTINEFQVRYRVVRSKPPHVHDWRVNVRPMIEPSTGMVSLVCTDTDCTVRWEVPNRLPIEVPE